MTMIRFTIEFSFFQADSGAASGLRVPQGALGR